MKSKFFLFCTALLFAATLTAETVTFSGVKFITSRTQVKDLGNGTFEVTIPAGKGWPMLRIIPENMPKERNTVEITVQQIEPKGALRYRLRLAMEPGKTSANLQMAPVLRDNKPHNFVLGALAGKKMDHFSIAAHMPDKEIKLLISNIKVTAASSSAR